MLETLLAIWLFLLGLAIGSFLNVVIARLPAGESIVHPRSRCPRCGHQLAWYENVPVFSWLALKGRCSSCKAPISPRYLVVELLTGLLFVACLARLGWDWPLAAALAFVTVLVPLVFIDAELWVLPFELTLPGIALGLAFRVPQGTEALVTGLWGAAVGFLAFRLIEAVGWWATGRTAMGAGDKYLVAMVGATLGWSPLLGVLLLSSLQGAVYGLLNRRLTGRAGPAHPSAPPRDPAPEPPAAAPAPAAALDLPPADPVAPAPEGPPPPPGAPGREPWTPAFLAPGLPVWRRLLLVPYAGLLQDIPDPPPLDEHGEAPDWVPGASDLPFGPWIGLAALEVLLVGPTLVALARHTPLAVTAQVIFGALR